MTTEKQKDLHKKPIRQVETTVWRGHFAEDATLRAEFFSACKFQDEDRQED